nr:hypothetical protein [uncultured Methanospirillum sp.]
MPDTNPRVFKDLFPEPADPKATSPDPFTRVSPKRSVPIEREASYSPFCRIPEVYTDASPRVLPPGENVC